MGLRVGIALRLKLEERPPAADLRLEAVALSLKRSGPQTFMFSMRMA